MAELTDIPDQTTLESEEEEQSRSAVLMWQIIIVGIGVIFVLLLALRLWQTKVSEHRADGLAPAFTFTTFEGETYVLDDLKGQGVVLNFWASWCDPCRDEAALLEQNWRREKDNGIIFLGLDYLDQEPAAQAYLDEFNITYPNGPDLRSETARHYGIKGVPETFFIGPDGEIKKTVIGPLLSQSQLDSLLDQIRP